MAGRRMARAWQTECVGLLKRGRGALTGGFCLVYYFSGFYYRGNYFSWVVKPSKAGFITHRGSKSQVKRVLLPA